MNDVIMNSIDSGTVLLICDIFLIGAKQVYV